ncbi:MAG TPA: hypothetical protein VG028_20625 [Terriglobia bacterium]|nr:hypothetical protein [Terriglobia bacterium]
MAQVTYSSTYPTGYSRALVKLGSGGPESADHANLIDAQLASGIKAGYRFTYRPGPPDAAGRINSYSLVARPLTFGTTGDASFFTDQTGVIRMTKENREPTVNDSPLAG